MSERKDQINDDVKRIYRTLFIDIYDNPAFLDLPRQSRDFYLQVYFNASMTPLGIYRMHLYNFINEKYETPVLIQAYLKDCIEAGLIEYDNRTHILWLKRYFDSAPKPLNSVNFRRYLKQFFIPLPHSIVKVHCASDLKKRAKKWGENYQMVAELFIRRAPRQPNNEQKVTTNSVVTTFKKPKSED